MLGTNAHFGTYSVSNDGHSIIFYFEHASFPNWDVVDQKRPFTLVGDDLIYSVPNPAAGGKITGEVK
jgi:hypothetical protein